MLALHTLAGVTGFEPAWTRFGDERPSHRVITPVAVATGVEPVPPDRQSGILPLDSATMFQIGCEGTIRTCMNRVRAGYPGHLDDLATLRRERADTVRFLDKRSNRSLHHSSNLSPLLLNERPPLLTLSNWLPGSDSNARIRIQSPESCR